MKNYQVLCLGIYYVIQADNWSVSSEGLKFYQNDKIVFWFISWDFWRILSNET